MGRRLVLNRMVYFSEPELDRAFAALADPTRRAIIERLANAPELTVSEIAAPFAVSLPGVMKHLEVLARARLIERNKVGRSVHCRLSAAAMRGAIEWLERYRRFWSGQLDALAKFVEETPWPAGPAAASGANARRPRGKSPPRRKY